ncbi:Heterogeneous nuclear ribonucleoprotein F [Chlorella vulgaris]
MSVGNVLRLRGLPFTANSEDVVQFFAGIDVQAVYLGSKSGKNTGEAYVEMQSPEDAQKALQEKQHQHIGSRYIEIFVAGEADLLAQTSGGENARPSLRGHVVRLRGLPFNSTALDVLQFFKGVETVGGEGGVVFTCTPDGRPTGEAYVALASSEALAAALARHKDKIGSRYIEIFESSKGDMYQSVQPHGYFTTIGGRRRHHWHQQHGGMGAGPAAGQYAAEGGGAGGSHTRGSQMDEMSNAFAGFGLSQRDMQVPGPPRWGSAYGAAADQQYQQYMGAPPRQPQQGGGMAGGAGRWRPAPHMLPSGVHMQQRPGSMQQHFNPAPGPPPGKGGRGAGLNGTRQGGGGTGMVAMHPHMHPHHHPHHEYGGQGPQLMFNPFMMQHPLMVQHHHPHQHQGSPWGAPGIMQQQVQAGAWYGGMHVSRPGMAPAYPRYTPAAAYYHVRGSGPGQPGGNHQGQQQYGSRQQHGSSQAGVSASQRDRAAAAATASSQPAAQTPLAESAGQPADAGSQGQPAAPPPEQQPVDEPTSRTIPEQ